MRLNQLRFSRAEQMAVLMIVAGGGLFLGLIGPFGDYHRVGWAYRLWLWVLYALAGSFFYIGAYKVLPVLSKGAQAWSVSARIAAACAAATPFMFVTVEIIGLALGRPLPGDGGTILISMIEIAAIGAIALCVFHLMTRGPQGEGGPASEPALMVEHGMPEHGPLLPQALSRKLGPDFGPAIYCVKAEGHYARVYGAHGDRLVDLSLSEVEAVLDGVDGAIVHRSWWVARRAIDRTSVKAGSLTLTLLNGMNVPVARRRRAQLRASGWMV